MNNAGNPRKVGFPDTFLHILAAFKRTMRLGNCLMGILIVSISSFVVLGFGITDHLIKVVPACFVAFSLMAGGNMMNDVFDAGVDRVAHPTRAIPRGIFSKRFVLFWAVSFFILALFFAALINIHCFLFALGGELLLLVYELFLKKYPGVGNLVIGALVGCIFLGTAAALDRWKIISYLALLGFLVNVAREMIKDIEDIEGDVDRMTFPKRFGIKKTLYVSWGILILNIAISPLPYFPLAFFSSYMYLILMGLTNILVIYSIHLSRTDAERSQQLLKFAMLVALMAFVLGNGLIALTL